MLLCSRTNNDAFMSLQNTQATCPGAKPMRFLIKAVLGLFISGLLTTHSLADDEASESVVNIQTLIVTLTDDIETLRFLIDKIETEETADREVLVYRQDERVFSLLEDYDLLVNETINLPGNSPQRQEIKQQLTGFGAGLDSALFDRIDEIKQQVIEQSAQLQELSGTERIAAQAYIENMESTRVEYYKAIANHIRNRNELELPTEKLREQMASKLQLYSETLAGRIELTSAARNNVQNRLAHDPDNADLDQALKELNNLHDTNLLRLEAIILVLDQLELDSSEYKAVMLQHANNISVSLFSVDALLSVLKDSGRALQSAIKNNVPDLIFRVLLFVAIVLLFRALSRLTKKAVGAACNRANLDMSALLKNIMVSTSGGTVMALGILMALSQVGISLAPMLAGLGVAGFIVGFALQDSLGNFAAGAMILIYRPFDVDDFVEVTGASGLVKKMNLVSTTIVTFDNQTLVVPNSKIWGDVIKNVTAQTERRVDLEFGIGYDDDIDLAQRVLTDIVTSHEKILSNPEPLIKLHTLGDSSVNFIVRPWAKTEDYWSVYWYLMKEVKLRFDREGISIPFPQRDVHVYSESKEPS